MNLKNAFSIIFTIAKAIIFIKEMKMLRDLAREHMPFAQSRKYFLLVFLFFFLEILKCESFLPYSWPSY